MSSRDFVSNGLFILAVLYTLYFTSAVLIPITLAVFLSLVFSPVVRFGSRRRVPAYLSAAVIVTTLIGAFSLMIGSLAEPAQQWLSSVPATLSDISARTRGGSSLSELSELNEQIDQLTKSGNGEEVQRVVMQGPGLMESLLGSVPLALQFLAIVLFLTFFLLGSGDGLLRKLVNFSPSLRERKRMVRIFRRIQIDIASYLGVVTLINIGLGATTTLAMFLLGVPNPALWGVMVGLFNFAPYLGAFTSLVVFTFVGFSTFPTLLDALLVPGVFLLITAAEGQLITPMLVSKRLSLSPAVVFLSVIVWGWLWGAGGALLAVPIVASMKVILENNRRLKPLADLLGG